MLLFIIVCYFLVVFLMRVLRFLFGPIFEYAYESAIKRIQETFNLQDPRAARAILHSIFVLLIIIISNA